MKRIFEFTDDKSNKFWSIEIKKSSFTVNYGKAGTEGQTQIKEFASDAECQKQADKLIAEKIKKGYVEITNNAESEEIKSPVKVEKPKAKSKITTKTTNEVAVIDISEEPTFREATEADMSAIIALMQRVLKANPIFREDIQKKLEGKGIAEFFNPIGGTVMLINNTIVGFSMYKQQINNLVIDPPYQRKGLGTKFFNHVYPLVKKAVIEKGTFDYIMVMFFTADELSKEFYKKQGFVKRAATNVSLLKMYMEMYTQDLPKAKKTPQKPANIQEHEKLDEALLKLCEKPKFGYDRQYTEKINELLSKGANPNVKYDDGTTPLFRLITNKNLHFEDNLINEFLLYSPDLNIRDNNGLTILHYLAMQEQPFLINKYAAKLVEEGADAKALDNEGNTPLFFFNTTYGGDSGEAVDAMVEIGIDPTVKNNKGENALAYRAEKHPDMGVLVALMRAVPVIDTDTEGNSVLHLGAKAEENFFSESFIQYAIKKGLDVNARNKNGQTALHVAKKEYLTELLNHKPDFNAQDNEGNTPLHTHNDKDRDILHLLKANPDVHIKNNAGVSAAEYIHSLGFSAVSNQSLQLLEDLEKLAPGASKTVSDTKEGFVPQQVEDKQKFTCKKLAITGSIVLQGNDGETGVSYIGNNQLQVVADHWGEITDVVDLTDSSVWRIPPQPDRRVAGCISDEKYYYAVSVKGFEALYQNLVKLDKATKNEIWTCGLSSYKGRLQFFQDATHIYYTDQKSSFIISKDKGKVLGKHSIIGLGIYQHNGKTMWVAYEPSVKKSPECKISLADPVSGDHLWVTALPTNGEQVRFSTIDGEKLYVVGEKDTIYVIDLKTGKITKTVQIENVDFKKYYSDTKSMFIKNGDLLQISLEGWDVKAMLTIDTKNDSCTLTDLYEVVPSGRLSSAGCVVNGYILSGADNGLYLFDALTLKQVAFVEAMNYGGNFNPLSVIVLGDTIYLLQKGGLTHNNSSVLHQIKNV